MAREPIDADARSTSTGPWLVVLLLLLVGILNYLDRVLPAILAEQIKADLALSDTALGLINGFGFLLIYAVATIPLAQMADRGRYGLVVTGALTLWSAMTALGGLVATGWQLALSRMGVAIGEAGGMPSAHAYIIRHFPARRRAAAISVFSLSLPFGSMLGFVIGGIAGQALGWRNTFLLMGGIGLVVAALTYRVLPRGPAVGAETGEDEAGADPAHLSLFGFVPLLRKRSLLLILAGAGLFGMGGYTATTFVPAFLMRSHGLSVAEAGMRFGVAGGIASAVGLLSIGWISDRLSQRDPRWLLGTVILMVIAALPISILSFRIEDTDLAILALAVNYAVPIAYSAPVALALHSLAPLELRARMSALMLLTVGIVGGFGPLIAGALSDAMAGEYGRHALGRALNLIPALYVLGCLCFITALFRFHRELDPGE